MKKQDIKEGISVIDRGYLEKGTGIIKEVKKTVFKVVFGNKEETWDFPHAKFLDKVDITNEELIKQYPIQDDIWASRRWNNDRTDYVDLSGH